MRTPASTPAFDFADRGFDHGDVILAAIGWGEWQALERSLADDLARQSDAHRHGEPVGSDELRPAIVAFRRARRLLAGEEYLRWLAERSLSTSDLTAHLERAALRERAGESRGPRVPEGPGRVPDLVEVIDTEALLSGRLQSWSERLAGSAAARSGIDASGAEPPALDPEGAERLFESAAACEASGLTADEVRARSPRIAELLAAERAFRDLVATPKVIEQRLRAHQLDWQRVVWSEARFPTEGAALEAALFVREDGMSLDAAAELAHVRSTVREAYCSEVPDVAELLSAGLPGELVGPFCTDGHWRLACVRDRAPVSAEDSELRERAIAEALEDALSRNLAGRVTWHGRD